MSLLRTLFGSLTRPYTCLVANSYQAHRLGLHTSHVARAEHDQNEVQSKNTNAEDKPASATQPSLKHNPLMLDPDFRPGHYFPTADVYEMLVDGERFDKLPHVHITATKNNTKASVFYQQRTVAMKTGGMCGFKNTKKSTNIAAQAVGMAIGQELLKNGLKNCRVTIDGVGQGRLPSVKGMQLVGINIVSIGDRTYPKVGMRPRKARRL